MLRTVTTAVTEIVRNRSILGFRWLFWNVFRTALEIGRDDYSGGRDIWRVRDVDFALGLVAKILNLDDARYHVDCGHEPPLLCICTRLEL